MDNSITQSFGKEDHRLALSRAKRIALFIAIIILRSFIVINMSAISAAVESIKDSLQINNQQFSQFNTFFSIGRICSSIAFVSLINVLNRKYMFLLAISTHCIALILFANITNFFVLLGIRSIHGFCMLFCFVYFPIWVDQFGLQKNKSLMMTILTLSSAGGLIWGYLLNLFLDKTQWRIMFLIEASIMAIFATFFSFFSSNYFDKSIFFSNHIQIVTLDQHKGAARSEVGMVSIFNKTDHMTQTNNNKDNQQKAKSNNQRLCTSLFVLLVLAKSVYFFIGGASQFWFTDYLQTALDVQDKTMITLSYSIIFIISPCIGQVIGGSICSYIGGYESKNALLVAFLLLLTSTPFCLTVPFMNDVKTFTFFFSCFTMCENSSSIITNSLVLVFVSKEMRGKANGLYSLFYNIFGLLPSASIYAIVNKQFSHLSKKAGMFCVLFYSIVGVSLLFSTLLRQISKRKEEAIDQKGTAMKDKKPKKEQTDEI